MFNAKVMALVTSELAATGKVTADGLHDSVLLHSALNVLSIVRGPDSEGDMAKAKFSAPLRRWLFGNTKMYGLAGYYPNRGDTDVLTESKVVTLWEQAIRSKVWATEKEYTRTTAGAAHYYDHIRYALESVARIEGWEKATAKMSNDQWAIVQNDAYNQVRATEKSNEKSNKAKF